MTKDCDLCYALHELFQQVALVDVSCITNNFPSWGVRLRVITNLN